MSLSVVQSRSEDSRFASPSLGFNVPDVDNEVSLSEDIWAEPNFAGIVGQSSALRYVLHLVDMVAASDAISDTTSARTSCQYGSSSGGRTCGGSEYWATPSRSCRLSDPSVAALSTLRTWPTLIPPTCCIARTSRNRRRCSSP